MIQLPDNWENMLRVKNPPMVGNPVLILFLRNDADQYCTHWQVADPAFPLDDAIALIRNWDWTNAKAQVIKIDDVTREMISTWVEPVDQNWRPAPFPDNELLSLAQYKALRGLPNAA